MNKLKKALKDQQIEHDILETIDDGYGKWSYKEMIESISYHSEVKKKRVQKILDNLIKTREILIYSDELLEVNHYSELEHEFN